MHMYTPACVHNTLRYGVVKSVNLQADRGFAFIEYTNPESVLVTNPKKQDPTLATTLNPNTP